MPGSPSKTFELEIAPLWPKETQGVPGQQIAPGLKPFLEPQRWEPLLNQSVVPLGLRWRVTPNMGLPRAPFSVWRRHRKHGDPLDVAVRAGKAFVTEAIRHSLAIGGGIGPVNPLFGG